MPSTGISAILRGVIERRKLQNIFSKSTAKTKSEILQRFQAGLHRFTLFGSEPPQSYHIPGRIEVLGKHTDYAGGRSMVAATENGFIMTATACADRLVRIIEVPSGSTVEFEIHRDLEPAIGSWGNYPMTVARRLARNFPGDLRGAYIALASDLPPAAGLSSSSALIVAIFLALADVNRLWERDEFRRNICTIESLAGYLGCIENGQTFGDLAGDRGVGTFGGSQDHTAILGSQAHKLAIYKYCPVKLERMIDLPTGWTFAIASSGVVAEKTGAAMEKFNRISRRVAEILETWNRNTGRADATLFDAANSSHHASTSLRDMLAADDLRDRFDQFIAENDQIVPAAIEAIVSADSGALGVVVDRSQKLAETQLANQTPETAFLAHNARALGAIAASAFGAGFGGSVWALIDEANADFFLQNWSERYHAQFPHRSGKSRFFTTHPGPAACRILP